MARKPRLFIGSSVESLKMAGALKDRLSVCADAIVWTKGVFSLSKTNIESICDALSEFDFAVLVFAPDDVVKMRDRELPAPRDNVVFERGLFMGKLGRARVYHVVPRGADLRLPSDLLGVVPAQYDPDLLQHDVAAAVTDASDAISAAIGASWKVWDDEVVEKANVCRERLKQLLVAEIERAPARHNYPSAHDLLSMSLHDLRKVHDKAVPHEHEIGGVVGGPPSADLLHAYVYLEDGPDESSADDVMDLLNKQERALAEYLVLSNPDSGIDAVAGVLGMEKAELWIQVRELKLRYRQILVREIESAPSGSERPTTRELAALPTSDLLTIHGNVMPAQLAGLELRARAFSVFGKSIATDKMDPWDFQALRQEVEGFKKALTEYEHISTGSPPNATR